MNELPKELTPKLLDCVLGREVFDIAGRDKFDDKILHFRVDDGWTYLNLDTLTRKMKEWCRKQGYLISVIQYDEHYICYVNFKHTLDLSGFHRGGAISHYDGLASDSSEFEAVLKATQWVANEKGLL